MSRKSRAGISCACSSRWLLSRALGRGCAHHPVRDTVASRPSLKRRGMVTAFPSSHEEGWHEVPGWCGSRAFFAPCARTAVTSAAITWSYSTGESRTPPQNGTRAELRAQYQNTLVRQLRHVQSGAPNEAVPLPHHGARSTSPGSWSACTRKVRARPLAAHPSRWPRICSRR